MAGQNGTTVNGSAGSGKSKKLPIILTTAAALSLGATGLAVYEKYIKNDPVTPGNYPVSKLGDTRPVDDGSIVPGSSAESTDNPFEPNPFADSRTAAIEIMKYLKTGNTDELDDISLNGKGSYKSMLNKDIGDYSITHVKEKDFLPRLHDTLKKKYGKKIIKWARVQVKPENSEYGIFVDMLQDENGIWYLDKL